jgi:hypothetical protein
MKNRFKTEAKLMIALPIAVLVVGLLVLMFF